MIEIIAEIAQRYEGKPKVAELLAKVPVKADADTIKYRLASADKLTPLDYKLYDS